MTRGKTVGCMMVFVVAAACLAGSAAADGVMQAGTLYEGKITGIGPDGLILDWKLGGKKTFALSMLQKISVDGQSELNAAEDAYAAGDAKAAAGQYEAAKLKARAAWMKEFINARLIDCYGQSQQFARAVRAYVELCQVNSSLLVLLPIPHAMPKGNRDNDVALELVENALKAAPPDAPYVERLGRIKMNILIVQGDPNQVLDLVTKQLESPDIEIKQQARIKHIEIMLKLGRLDEAEKSLQVAKKELDPSFEKQLLFFEGRGQHARKDYLHAALSFMRIAILYPRDKNLAASALYWAGQSMSDSKVVPLDEVASPLREAVDKFSGTEGAAQAQRLLEELESGR